jgi:hypothetical protein
MCGEPRERRGKLTASLVSVVTLHGSLLKDAGTDYCIVPLVKEYGGSENVLLLAGILYWESRCPSHPNRLDLRHW